MDSVPKDSDDTNESIDTAGYTADSMPMAHDDTINESIDTAGSTAEYTDGSTTSYAMAMDSDGINGATHATRGLGKMGFRYTTTCWST
jgi:hypothetical protein